MGMSHYANHVVTINEDLLKKVCKKEYKAFEKALDKAEIDLNTWAEAVDKEETGDYAIGVYDAFENLRAAFRKSTKLVLCLGYVDPDMSERGDDVSGAFWEVGDVRDYTPAAKAFLKKHGNAALIDSFFCTFG